MAVLIAALLFLGLALGSALLGFSQAVVSFRGVALAVSYAFLAMLVIFLATALIAAIIRWMDRRHAAIPPKL